MEQKEHIGSVYIVVEAGATSLPDRFTENPILFSHREAVKIKGENLLSLSVNKLGYG